MSESDIRIRLENLAENGINFEMGKYFQRGIEIFRVSPIQLAFYTFLSAFAILFTIFIPLAPFVIFPAIISGFIYVPHAISLNKQHNTTIFYLGFDKLWPLALANFLVIIAVSFGLMFFILPGIFLMVCLSLVLPLVTLTSLSATEAIVFSFKIVYHHWVQFLILLFILLLLNIAGFFLFLGWIFTIPFTFCVLFAVVEEILYKHPDTEFTFTAEEEAYFRKLEGY